MKYFAIVVLILVAIAIAYAPAFIGAIEVVETATKLHAAQVNAI